MISQRIKIRLGISIVIFSVMIQMSIAQINYADIWQSFPACRMGRLQSPIKLNITNSVYNSTYSIVYQNYRKLLDLTAIKEIALGQNDAVARTTLDFGSGEGGYINFQKGGVIKQYELKRFELYQGSHQVELEISDYELHIVHEKVLGFTSMQNRYRAIQDANNFLVIVLRYSANGKESDNGLLAGLMTENLKGFDLSTYPVFQDKSSYYYEGAFMFNPCDEDVNYIVIEGVFTIDSTILTGVNALYSDKKDYGKKSLVYSYERPIYRNFMNYTESLNSIKLLPYTLMALFCFLLQL